MSEERQDIQQQTQEQEGWGFPDGSRKAHYFVETMSLCRRWGFYQGRLDNSEGPSTDDCVECQRRLKARVSSLSNESTNQQRETPIENPLTEKTE